MMYNSRVSESYCDGLIKFEFNDVSFEYENRFLAETVRVYYTKLYKYI